MAISATERVNHVLRRTSFLRARFAAIMRGAGLEPGAAAEIGEGDRVRLAFGYLDRTAGQGVRQRYV